MAEEFESLLADIKVLQQRLRDGTARAKTE